MGVGFIAWALLAAATGRARTVHPILWGIAGLYLVFFCQPFLARALGL